MSRKAPPLYAPSRSPAPAAAGYTVAAAAAPAARVSTVSQSTRVQLFFRVEGATTLAPCHVAVAHDTGDGRWVLAGQTEALALSACGTSFTRSVDVDFHFEERQPLQLYLRESRTELGAARVSIGDVVSSPDATRRLPLGTTGTTVHVTAVEVNAHSRDSVEIGFSARGLTDKGLLGKTDPYLRLFRCLANGTRQLLFETEVQQNTLEPTWTTRATLAVADLVAGSSMGTPTLEVECWDRNVVTADGKLGRFRCSLDGLLQTSDKEYGFTLEHPTKGAAKTYGTVYVDRAVLFHVPTFIELASAGMEVNVAVCVDFTASNGRPEDPKSLHHHSTTRHSSRGHSYGAHSAAARHGLNPYQRAMSSVCDVLLEYDSDRRVPVYGFGAELPDRRVHHCFHVNGAEDPYVTDVSGVMDAYRRAVTNVKLSGPTNFAPCIREVHRAARAEWGTYTIMLIVTDGVISDMRETIDEIVACDDAPLSIIIVGVGSADFTNMEFLDADDAPLVNSRGRVCRRDLVQFVPFAQFERAGQKTLAMEVLREVPDQVIEWAMLTGTRPEHFASKRAGGAGDMLEPTLPNLPPPSRR